MRVRLTFYLLLLAGLWIAGMALIVGALADGLLNAVTAIMLVAGGFVAATATVALAEEAAVRAICGAGLGGRASGATAGAFWQAAFLSRRLSQSGHSVGTVQSMGLRHSAITD
jgi:hypothetical protein